MWGRALNRRPLIEVNIESSLRVLFETNTPQTYEVKAHKRLTSGTTLGFSPVSPLLEAQ